MANVSSKIIYDAKTVEFEGSNALYNPVGVAVVVENLTVKDAEGKEQTIDAVAVSTEVHLKTLVAAGENVMLASDITLSGPLEITKSTTIVGNDHTLTASGKGVSRVINVNDNAGTVVLTLSNVKVDGSNFERGISAYGNSDVTLILDNCEVSADHYAINETGHFSTYAVMAEEDADEVIAEQTTKVEKMVSALKLKARSTKTEKGNIKVTLTVDADDIKAIEDLGYTVKYKFYRSTKKAASYKAKIEGTGKTYTNTAGTKGTRYYYKARVMVYDAQGELVTKSELKQCKYACRVK